MNFKKTMQAGGVVLAIVSTTMPALAGLSVVENAAEKPPVPPQQVVDEGARARAENDRLNREVDRLKAELGRVQAELANLKSNSSGASGRLAAINQSLDQIEQRMEAVGRALVRVNFQFASAKFEPTAQVADALVSAGKKATRVNVSGHADNTGTAQANRAIGLARALAAKQFLVAKGVSKGKVRVFSRGAAEPVADNGSEEGRAQNRRVDVEFVR